MFEGTDPRRGWRVQIWTPVPPPPPLYLRLVYMENLHVIVFKPFTDLSGIISIWETKCDEMLVVQHPAEGKTKRVHCHILMVRPKVKTDQLQKPLRNMGLSGNGDFSFHTKVARGEFKGQPLKRDETAKYMIKGKNAVNFQKNFSQEEVETFRQAWVESDLDTSTQDVPKSRDDVEWNYFLTKYEASKEKYTMIGIKNWIKSDCLRRRKPIPRSADLNRWSYSIYAITNNMTNIGDIHTLDEYAFNQFIKVD